MKLETGSFTVTDQGPANVVSKKLPIYTIISLIANPKMMRGLKQRQQYLSCEE